MSQVNRREFHFTTQDFQRISALIYQHAGIALSASKQELVYGRLARRLRATGCKTFEEYLAFLQQGNAVELEEFTNALTTNLTSFFREAHHFPMLAEYLRQSAANRPAVLWCAACSSGEEAYSMAMTAVEALGGYGHQVRIIASDLDSRVLETARNGRYKLESVSRLSATQLDKFFERGQRDEAGYVQVRPELQKMISFQRINLLDAHWPVREQLEVIFCRNVMIYFDKPTQLAILKKFAPLLRKDGLLFAGHSENFYHAEDYFKLRGQTVYQLADKQQAAGR